MKLSLIFPAYNEASVISNTLGDFTHYCVQHGIDHEIIVVNDGATDATSLRAKEFARAHPSIRIVHHPMNRGYGAALRSGFSAATGDYIFFTDSDGQFKAADLDQALPLVNARTIVIGYRAHRAEGLIRRMNAWLWGRLVGALLGFHVGDLNCAWKLFPRPLLADLTLTADGAFINAELLYYARRNNLIFKEIPVHHYQRQQGTSSGANIRVIVRAFKELGFFLIQRRRHL